MTVIARKDNVPRFAVAKVFRSYLRPRSGQRAALRAVPRLEKGRSPPRPLRPLGLGGNTLRASLGDLLVI